MTNANTPFSALPIAISLTGAEVLPADQAGTTKQVTAAQIAGLASAYLLSLPTVVIQAGASYSPQTTDVLIIVQKTIGSPTTINLPLSTTKIGFYYIKDGKGDAGTNTVTVAAAGGETIDGAASIALPGNYGVMQVAPDPLGGWVLINFG